MQRTQAYREKQNRLEKRKSAPDTKTYTGVFSMKEKRFPHTILWRSFEKGKQTGRTVRRKT